MRFRPATGEQIWARVICHAELRDGKVVLLYGSFQDVIQHCQTIEALRQSQARYQLLADHIHDSVTLHDLDGRYLDMTQSFAKLTGFRAEDWFGRDAYEVIHPDDRQRVRLEAHEANLKGNPSIIEWRCLRADGSYVWVESHSAPVLNAEGLPTYIVCVSRDISERKAAEAERERLQQRLRQTEKLESLAFLAGGFAHEFNNHLTGILGLTELTIPSLPVGSPLVDNLRAIEAYVHKAADVCQQLLTFAGKRQIILSDLAFDQVIKEALATVSDMLTEQTRLELVIVPSQYCIRGNREQLIAVVRGLVANAVEALPDSVGTVTVRLDQVSVTDPQRVPGFTFSDPRVGQYVRLAVQDTGQGIDQSLIPRLFEPFFSTKFTGRGLGLALILGTVRSHGGFITVESILKQGSTFSVYVPSSTPVVPAVLAPSGSGESTDQPNIYSVLIIEDDPVVREVASLMLQQMGWKVLTAEDGLIGLEIVQSQLHNINIVLLDSVMPRLDGLQTLKRLEQIAPNLPVVVMSGYHEQQISDLLKHLNVVRFVQKPFTSARLNQAILAALTSTKTK